ncbi:MAG: 6-bladed beta-propeller [Bacteroidaceae bacterium]|nr:6-bladed beta-propeller [Bacteroidaceae bacterium]
MRILGCCSVLLILSTTVGCGKSEENVTVISGADAVEMSFEDVASDIGIVPLVSPEPVEYGEVHLYGNELLMTDMDRKRLWYFRNHELVSELNAKGRGRGEYGDLFHISYSPASHTLLVKPAGDVSFIKYDVPSMRFTGKIPCEDFLSNFIAVDESRVLGFTGNDKSGRALSVIDIPSGESRVSFELTFSEFEYASFGRVLREPFRAALGLSDYVNRLGWLDADGRFEEVFKFSFSDGMPKNIYDIGADDMDNMIDYALYQSREHYFFGVIMPVMDDDGFTFWYCNNNGLAGDDSWLRLYCHNSERDFQAKDLYIPGLNFKVQPDGVTDDGGYYSVICGPEELIKDPVREPSALAERILEAVRNQKDDNPVIMYYKIR